MEEVNSRLQQINKEELDEKDLSQEVSSLTAQRDELQQKNTIVSRIMALANRRKLVKEKISMEEHTKSENLNRADD